MKKKRSRIIGRQETKPFPVVNMRFRLLEKDHTEICSRKDCKSLEYFPERPKALFMLQMCIGAYEHSMLTNFSNEERNHLLWQKAYQEQKAGKEPDPIGYPICVQCCTSIITRFLGDKDEKQAAQVIVCAVTTGEDLILFDRNFDGEHLYPCVACKSYETLADFRRAFWQQLEQGAIRRY